MRVTRLSARFKLNDMVFFALTIGEDIVNSEPRNYKEVMGCEASAELSKAKEEEMNSLKKNQTWCW